MIKKSRMKQNKRIMIVLTLFLTVLVLLILRTASVSYTHLDVYKRQD